MTVMCMRKDKRISPSATEDNPPPPMSRAMIIFICLLSPLHNSAWPTLLPPQEEQNRLEYVQVVLLDLVPGSRVRNVTRNGGALLQLSCGIEAE